MRATIRGKRVAAGALLVTLLGLLIGVAGGQPPIAWRWEETDPLPQSHVGHTATLLADGRVLVVGDVGRYQTTASLYDPASDTWSETGPLTTPRYGHTATLLADGQVLVAGGAVDQNIVKRSVELFDPATGAWTAVADMPTARAFHAAALLPDGKVLVMGGALGLFSTSGIADVELYDPATDTWAFAEPMNKARASHSATVLAGGRVLVVGGYAPGNVAELYDPATGAWRYTGGRGLDFQARHVAVRLDDGRVYVLDDDKAAVYDPATEAWAWQSSPAMGDIFAAALLGDGRVIVNGGYEQWSYPPVTIIYDTTVLVDTTTWDWEYPALMKHGRAGHTLTRLADGRVLAAGGLDYPDTGEVFRAFRLPERLYAPVAASASEEGRRDTGDPE